MGAGVRRVLAAALIVLACGTGPAPAFGAGASGLYAIEAKLSGPPEEILPGVPVTLRLETHNPGDEPVRFSVRFALPAGWRPLIAPGLTTLEPRERKVLLVSVFPASATRAGAHPVEAVLESPLGAELARASASIGVRIVNDLSVRWVNPPSYVIAEDYHVAYVVQNLSNSDRTIHLRVDESAGFGILDGERQFELASGESVEGTVTVRVPRDLINAVLQQLRLRAWIEGDPSATAEATTQVQIIPRKLSEAAVYHTFSLRVRLESAVRSDQEGFQTSWRVDGRGPLTDRDPGRFYLAATPDRYQWLYDRPGLRVSGGRQRFLLSPLSVSAFGDGVDVQRTFDGWSLRALYVNEGGGAPSWGAGFEFRPGSSLGVGASFGMSAGQGRRNWSLQGRAVMPQMPIYFEAEYAADEPVGPGAPPHETARGLRLEAQGGASWLGRVSWVLKEEGFGGAGEPTDRIDLALNVPIKPDVTLALDARVERRFQQELFDVVEQRHHSARVGLRSNSAGWQLGLRWAESPPSAGDASATDPAGGRSTELWYSQTWTDEAERAFFHMVSLRFDGEAMPNLRYDASLRAAPAQWGTLIPSLAVLSRENRLELNVRWQKEFTSRTTLGVTASVDNVASPSDQRVAVEFTHRTLTDYVWRVTARRQVTGTSELSEAFVTLTIPMEFPIGYRSDVGRVSGTVVGPDGRPIPDLVVQMEGQFTTTDGSGRFAFPAAPAGKRYLTLRSDQLSANLVTRPATPLAVDVEPGSVHEIELRVVPGGTIRGKIELDSGRAAGDRGTISGGPASESASVASLVRGMVAVLQNPEGETYLRPVDASGTFYFDRVPPGQWEVYLSGVRLPGDYRLEASRQSLAIEPGESHDVVFRITPVVRRIQFIQQGTVVSESDK